MKSPPDTGGFVAVARVVRPQGRRGEVAAELLTDFPERFARTSRVFLETRGAAPVETSVEAARLHKGRVVLKFSGVNSIGEAERLRGLHVFVPASEAVELPAHHYFVSELQGCRVVRGESGEEIGTVTGVEKTGGADLLHVSTRRGEVLIPLAQEICTSIDTAGKTIVIHPPGDLLELNESAPGGRGARRK